MGLIHYPFIAEFWIKNILDGAIPPLPVGTRSVLGLNERHRSIEYEENACDEGPDERPQLHHSDSIQVTSLSQSPVDSGKSGGKSDGSAERVVGSPVYKVSSPCGMSPV